MLGISTTFVRNISNPWKITSVDNTGGKDKDVQIYRTQESLTLLRPPFVLLAEPLQSPNVGINDRLVLPTTPKTPNFDVEEC